LIGGEGSGGGGGTAAVAKRGGRAGGARRRWGHRCSPDGCDGRGVRVWVVGGG
jgi:hypothetical protein